MNRHTQTAPDRLETELILFDLDGTLVDTAPDMARALNDLLADEAREPLPFDEIRAQVSNGANGLLRLAFGADLDAERAEALRTGLLEHYRADLARESVPFPGTRELLDQIEAAGLRWGVVTNKAAWLAEPLLAELGLYTRAAVVVAGDTLAQCKPDPAPLHFACSRAGVVPERAIYVGDAERDVQAAIAAGMPAFVALYGYIGLDEDPNRWGESTPLEHPSDLWSHIRCPARHTETP